MFKVLLGFIQTRVLKHPKGGYRVQVVSSGPRLSLSTPGFTGLLFSRGRVGGGGGEVRDFRDFRDSIWMFRGFMGLGF